MNSLGTALVTCDQATQVVAAINHHLPKLPLDVRKRLNKIKLTYFQRHGEKGLYERINNKSIATVLAEFEASEEPKLISSGECDGLRYELYDTGTEPVNDEPQKLENDSE